MANYYGSSIRKKFDCHTFRLSLICISVIIFVFLPVTTFAVDVSGNDPANETQTELQYIQNMINPLTVGSGVIVTILTIILTPIVKEKFDKRQAYLQSYTQWCVNYAGILHEFEELCGWIRCDMSDKLRPSSYRPTDILSHIWQMHQETEEGVKWLIMIKRHDVVAGNALDTIMDGVDRLWHMLENDYFYYFLRNSASHDEFKKILLDLKTYTPTLMNNMIIRICLDILRNNEFQNKNFKNIMCFLYKRAPGVGFWWFIPASCKKLYYSK